MAVVLKTKDYMKNNEKGLPKFNTKEALAQFLDKEKYEILIHPAGKKVLCGAKDAGKTVIVIANEIYCMELDPKANCIALRKYAKGASKRLGADLNRLILVLKQHYYFPIQYTLKQDKFVREYGLGDIDNNQIIELDSYENANGIAGITPANNGYFVIVHFEEPSQILDVNSIKRSDWNRKSKNIMDSAAKRSVREYNKQNPKYLAQNPTLYVTFNDWDEEFCESQDLEYFIPRDQFLQEILGGISPTLLLGNKEMLDKNWEKIKKSLLTNHTKTLYVKEGYSITMNYDRDRLEKHPIRDTLYARMSKFANPGLRNIDKDREETFIEIYDALLSGNPYELARTLGMLDDGADSMATTHFFPVRPSMMAEQKEIYPEVDTTNWLRQEILEGRRIPVAFSVGWDADVNRRAVGTPMSLSIGIRKKNPDNPWDTRIEYYDPKLLIHKQEIVLCEGSGGFGHLSKIPTYAKQMDEITCRLYDTYLNYVFCGKMINRSQTYCLVDDGIGGFMSYLHKTVKKFAVTNKTKRNGNWSILKRQVFWQTGIDEFEVIIDYQNKPLMKFLEFIPKNPQTGQRIEKGKFESLADFANSAEASGYILNTILQGRLSKYDKYRR